MNEDKTDNKKSGNSQSALHRTFMFSIASFLVFLLLLMWLYSDVWAFGGDQEMAARAGMVTLPCVGIPLMLVQILLWACSLVGSINVILRHRDVIYHPKAIASYLIVVCLAIINTIWFIKNILY